MNKKLHNFQMMCGTIRRTLGKKVREETMMKFYKTMAVPVLMYGSETWVTKSQYQKRIQSAEMKFLRYVKNYTLEDQIRNSEIRDELGIYELNDRIKSNKLQWKEHVDRMQDNRIPKITKNYRAVGKRNPGRPKKRWNEIGTGL